MTGIPRFESFERELRDQHGAPAQTILTVSGLTGVGTSTIATFLADQFELEHFDAGQFFREQAARRDMDIQEFDRRTEEIEAEEGIDFDLEWDRTALEYAFTRDRFVLEGRLTGALLRSISPVRIWVHCDPAIVAERLAAHDVAEDGDRVADRDGMTRKEAEDYVRERNRKVLARYEEKYGIDPRDDRFYNVRIDNSQDLDRVKSDVLEQVRAQLPDSVQL